MTSNSKGDDVPDEASQLLGLFQQQPSENNDDEKTAAGSAAKQVDASVSSGASNLLNLFSPPPTNDNDSGLTEKPTHTRKVAAAKKQVEESVSSNRASNLMNLFQPPPTTSENYSADMTEYTTPVKMGNLSPRKSQSPPAEAPGTPPQEKPAAASLINIFQPPGWDSSPVRRSPVRRSSTSSSADPTPTIINKTTQSLQDLFAPPPTDTPEKSFPPQLPDIPVKDTLEKQSTERFNSVKTLSVDSDMYPLLEDPDNFDEFNTPQATNSTKRAYNSIPPPPMSSAHNRMESIHEDFVLIPIEESKLSRFRKWATHCSKEYLTTSTFLGGFIFLLYHIVFCLAMGSTISAGRLGTMAKMATSGVIFVSPIYIHMLGTEIPSQYPTTDLFLAPFMAKLATIVQDTLVDDPNYNTDEEDENSHNTFLCTFAVLTGIGMAGSGLLIMLATTFKLANLGSFLPFPVLCGFFSAVGVLLWTLSLAVDTGGKTVTQVLSSGSELSSAVLHHGPSLVAGIIMKIYGSGNPFFGTYVILGLIVLTYTIMFLTGTSLEEAKTGGWFWTSNDLMSSSMTTWLPPAPFGVLFGMRHVHWGAVYNGLETAMALAFLYLLRCSLHATALKKNVNNLKRPETAANLRKLRDVVVQLPSSHRRRFTEDVDIEAIQTKHGDLADEIVMVVAKNPTISLQHILVNYGYGQFIAAALGSFGVTPAIAAMSTMYTLGAEGRAPQYVSLLFLLIFYLTDFRLVAYIPKMSFSCLVVLSFLDMVVTWFVESYSKTKEKMEWLVVPVIVVCAFVVGLLNSVFVGIAFSTFIFVAAFFRSGVVKYLSNGLTIRSTIERSLDDAAWLDQHGDMIQLVVLQNYLFFGNASSMLSYISSMFEEVSMEDLDYDVPPLPKYIVLDLTLVTGMDTSTIDVFNDVKTICKNNDAKLYVAGLSPSLRSTLALGNFKPETGVRSKRSVRFFADLDAAIGKAEDSLLGSEMLQKETYENVDIGNEAASFQRALQAIDEQHGKDFAMDLMDLYDHTTPVALEQGSHLYACEGGPVADCNRGLFFIASGTMKIERDSSMSMTRGSAQTGGGSSLMFNPNRSLGSMQARTGTIGKESALLKSGARQRNAESFIRLARVGPGWVVGLLEGVGASQYPSHQVAVTKCKLHHLPYHKIEELQEQNPQMILRLYKLLSHLMARRQEITIGQLVTLHSIMTSPAAGKPIGRSRASGSGRGSLFQ